MIFSVMTDLTFKQIIREKNAFALPNLLSFSRIFFIPLICYLISLNDPKYDTLLFVIVVAGAATDFLDGFIARHYNLESTLGKLLDPILDKVGIGSIMLFLVIYKELPLWYFLIVVTRDVIIAGFGIFFIISANRVKQSTTIGKWTVFSYTPVVILFLFDVEPYNYVALVTSLVFILLSAISYGRVLYKESS